MQDKETQAIVGLQKKLYDLVHHEGWAVVRDRFSETILRLQNVNAVVGKTQAEKIRCLEVNKGVSEALFEILAQIEGEAETYETNKDIIPRESFIHRT